MIKLFLFLWFFAVALAACITGFVAVRSKEIEAKYNTRQIPEYNTNRDFVPPPKPKTDIDTTDMRATEIGKIARTAIYDDFIEEINDMIENEASSGGTTIYYQFENLDDEENEEKIRSFIVKHYKNLGYKIDEFTHSICISWDIAEDWDVKEENIPVIMQVWE